MKKLRVISLVLSLVLLSALFGCGPSEPTGDAGSSEAPSVSQAASTAEGTTPAAPAGPEVFRVGVSSLPATGDPTRNTSNAMIRIAYNVFDTLIFSNPTKGGALEPALAESWSRIDDKTLELKLRQDVTWHNGDPFTSADVQYTFERLSLDLEGTTLLVSLLGTIDHTEIIDDYTCRIVTSVPDPALEQRLTAVFGAWIVPKKYIEEVGEEAFNLSPIGTGPYKYVSISPEDVVIERYDGFYGEKAPVGTIEYKFYPEVASRISALTTGELDMITELPFDQMETVENMDGIHSASVRIQNMHLVQYYTGNSVMADQKLRQALNLAIDRQLLVDTLWSGATIVPQGHQFEEYGDLFFSDFPIPEYDPEKAKALLAESSYNGELITYELREGYYMLSNEAAEAIVDMWSQIGVNAQVKFQDAADENTMLRPWSNTMRFPDPAGGLWLLWGLSGDVPPTSWPDMPEDYRAAGKALVEASGEDRARLARELMDLWVEYAPGTVLYFPLDVFGLRDGVQWTPYAPQTISFRADNLIFE